MSAGQIGLSLLKGAVQGALAGAGGPIGAGIASWKGAAVSAISSQMPGISIPLGDNFSFSLSPSLAFGTNDLSFGGNATLSGSAGDFNFGVGMGMGNTVKAFDQGAKGWYRSIGGGFGIGGVSASLMSIKGSGADYYNQTIRGLSYRSKSGGFSVGLYNDWPSSDKGRTFSFNVRAKEFEFGAQIVTTEGSNFKAAKQNKDGWISRTWKSFGKHGSYDENSKRITSPFYFGYSERGFSYRLGMDSPYVQDFFQNGWHRLIGSPWFRTDYDTRPRLYTFYGNTGPYFF